MRLQQYLVVLLKPASGCQILSFFNAVEINIPSQGLSAVVQSSEVCILLTQEVAYKSENPDSTPCSPVCGMGNTKFCPLSDSIREVLARSPICQHFIHYGPEATTGFSGWKLWFVTSRCLNILSRSFYTSWRTIQHLAVWLRQSFVTPAASQQVSGTEEFSTVSFPACLPPLAPCKRCIMLFYTSFTNESQQYWKSNTAIA